MPDIKLKGRPRHYHKWSSEQRKKYHRAAHLWQFYKMRPVEYDEILNWQEGVCCICGGTNPSGKKLAVDHDHVTGKTRNLLCSSCNKGLGLFKDDPELLENAMLYLKAWKEYALVGSTEEMESRNSSLRRPYGSGCKEAEPDASHHVV